MLNKRAAPSSWTPILSRFLIDLCRIIQTCTDAISVISQDAFLQMLTSFLISKLLFPLLQNGRSCWTWRLSTQTGSDAAFGFAASPFLPDSVAVDPRPWITPPHSPSIIWRGICLPGNSCPLSSLPLPKWKSSNRKTSRMRRWSSFGLVIGSLLHRS